MKIESVETITPKMNHITSQSIFIFDKNTAIVYASLKTHHPLYRAVQKRLIDKDPACHFPDAFAEDLKETLLSGENRHGNLTVPMPFGNNIFAYTVTGSNCPIIRQPLATVIFNLINILQIEELVKFQDRVYEIFETYQYPVCLCDYVTGKRIYSNRAYALHFPHEDNRVFCWDSFATYRKIFTHCKDWQAIPFTYRHTESFYSTGRFSVGSLQMGVQTALIFSFSIQPECPEGRFYNTDDIVKSLEAQYSRFAASLGHEVGNVLTVLAGNLQLLDEMDAFKDHQETYGELLAELDRSIQLTASMRQATDKPSIHSSTYLEDIIQGMKRIMIFQAALHNVRVDFCLQKTAPVFVNENEIRQVLLNLFKNAYESMENGGTIAIGIKIMEREVIISILDQGPGIPPHIAARIGSPFISTKEKGTGLGLSICYEKVHANNGRIEFDSSNEGTCFRIIFPIYTEAAQTNSQ